MALKIWLPFTNDARNYGTAILNNPSINTVALNDGGKVGNKRMTGQLGWHLSSNTDVVDNQWTVSVWFKLTASSWGSGNIILFCKNTTTANGQIYFSVKVGNYLNIGINGTGEVAQYNYSFQLNTWYHVAATFTGSYVTLYLNGTKVKGTSFTGTKPSNHINIRINGRASTSNNNSGTTGNSAAMQLNDFRLYDEALSPAGIKEISRGLVRHYKFDNTNIIDSSLNNINGTTTGTLTTSTDSGRYSNSLVFSGSQRIEAGSLPSETKTISVWAKTDYKATSSLGQKIIMIDQNTNLCIGFYASGICTSNGAPDAGTGSSVNTDLYIVDEWNHIVVIKTSSTTRDVYINGQKATPNGGAQFSNDLNQLVIGSRRYNETYEKYFEGQISDFRAYATELSEADILELYQMGAKIDSKNKFHTYELVEDSSAIKINKKGQLQINELNETTGINFDSTKDLNANELIEI